MGLIYPVYNFHIHTHKNETANSSNLKAVFCLTIKNIWWDGSGGINLIKIVWVCECGGGGGGVCCQPIAKMSRQWILSRGVLYCYGSGPCQSYDNKKQCFGHFNGMVQDSSNPIYTHKIGSLDVYTAIFTPFWDKVCYFVYSTYTVP